MNDVVAQKVVSLQRCVARAREVRRAAADTFGTNYLFQDAAILNVVRACDTAIDLANMLIRAKRLGIPTESRESFAILEREGLLAGDLAKKLKAMVGFRNLAVHQYRDIDLNIVLTIIEKDCDDLLRFAEQVRTTI
jgi:uncharacterized protein YutE (UPF0331/DUF86 family)